MIKDFDKIQKEFNKNLMRRRSTDNLWGNPFENALVGIALLNQTPVNKIVIKEIVSYLEKWIEKDSFFQRDLVTLGLYSVLLIKLRNTKKFDKAVSVFKKNIKILYKKEQDTKFSIFNSPELFYFTSLAISETKNGIEIKILTKFKDIAKKEVQDRWKDKPIRFAFFAGAALELSLKKFKDDMGRFIKSLNIEDLRTDEVIPVMWFLIKYKDEVDVEDNVIDQMINQFEAQRQYFSFERPSEEQPNIYYPSNLDLVLLDEAFTVLKTKIPTNPNLLFDALQFHPKIKKVSEDLFKNRHYASAIFEAYKELNNFIKQKSRKRNLDGFKLMSSVFSFDYDDKSDKITRKPVLKLNRLSDQSERDEQQGFMHIFMGAMLGIRNPKGHETIIQNDPYRALEYLSLASLLAKRVDEAKKTR